MVNKGFFAIAGGGDGDVLAPRLRGEDAEEAIRRVTPTPIGHDTPVPPNPQ